MVDEAKLRDQLLRIHSHLIMLGEDPTLNKSVHDLITVMVHNSWDCITEHFTGWKSYPEGEYPQKDPSIMKGFGQTNFKALL